MSPMRRWMLALPTLAVLACGGSEQPSSTPQQAQPQPPAPRPRPPAFPAAERFRLGEAVALRGAASAECSKLYFGDAPVAVVRTFVHVGTAAVALRCQGASWADPMSPTPEELAAVGASLEGRLAPEYDALGVTPEGTLTFTSLSLPDRVSDLSFSRRWATYVSIGAPRDGAGGREADAIGVIYDVPVKAALDQILLGTCRLGSGTPPLALGAPTWSGDGGIVTFHGSDRCTFQDVEAHPE